MVKFENVIINLSRYSYCEFNSTYRMLSALKNLDITDNLMLVKDGKIMTVFENGKRLDNIPDYYVRLLNRFINEGLIYYVAMAVTRFYNEYVSNPMNASLDYDYISTYAYEYSMLNHVNCYIDFEPFKKVCYISFYNKGGEK